MPVRPSEVPGRSVEAPAVVFPMSSRSASFCRRVLHHDKKGMAHYASMGLATTLALPRGGSDHEYPHFRFANSFLEPIWNRDYIASVQVSLSETFGVKSRGAFYETDGRLRDVVENHLFQIVALLAMETPAGGSAFYPRGRG
jgi:hypothetical protein